MEPPDGQTPRRDGAASTAPFWLLVACLAGVAVFFVVRPILSDAPAFRPRPGRRTFDYWYVTFALFLPYAWAMRAAVRGMILPNTVLLGGAAAIALILVPAPPQQSQDVYQYLVYGEMATRGVSPYAALPADADSPWIEYSSWPETASVYGPVWTALSEAAVSLSGGSLMGALITLKAMGAVLSLVAAAGLLTAARGRSGVWTPTAVGVAFAYNPLVVMSTGLAAHADVAVAAAIAWAVAAERKGRPAATTALLAAAALVKPYAGVALLVWLIALAKRSGVGRSLVHAAGSAVAAVASFAPYWGGLDSLRGFTDVGRMLSTSLVGSIVRVMSGRADVAGGGFGIAGVGGRVTAAAALTGGLVWALRSTRTRERPWFMAAALFLLYVLVTPWYLYWHLLGPLALVLAAGSRGLVVPALVFSATSLIVVAPPLHTGAATADLVIQTTLRYGPPLVAGAILARRYAAARGGSGTGRDRGGLSGRDRAARGAGAAGGPGDG